MGLRHSLLKAPLSLMTSSWQSSGIAGTSWSSHHAGPSLLSFLSSAVPMGICRDTESSGKHVPGGADPRRPKRDGKEAGVEGGDRQWEERETHM